jgi:hypothetical protein
MKPWSSIEYVQWLYRSLLAREADPDGLRHFSLLLDAGTDLKVVAHAILSSEEYRGKTGLKGADPLNLSQLQPRPIVIVDVGARLLESEDHI